MGFLKTITLLIVVISVAFGTGIVNYLCNRLADVYHEWTGHGGLVGINQLFLTPEQVKYGGFESEEMQPDLRGRVCLVTGANIGLGFETARWQYLRGCNVVAAGRRELAIKDACKRIMLEGKETENHGDCIPMTVDLAKLNSVQRFAKQFRQKFKTLDIYVMNAGLTFWKSMTTTEDGIESMFQVNHLSHFYLTHLLSDMIGKSEYPAKIVLVSSAAHYGPFPVESGIFLDLKSVNNQSNWDGIKYYAMSKLANVLYAQTLSTYLNKREGYGQVYVNAASPGVTKTNVTEEFKIKARQYSAKNPVLSTLTDLFLAAFNYIETAVCWSAADGARTQIFLSISPEVHKMNLTAGYYHPQVKKVAAHALTQGEAGQQLGEKLWDFSEQILRIKGFM